MLGIVFFVVAAAAPLVGMTGAAPVAIAAGSGAGAPGAYVAVGIVLLMLCELASLAVTAVAVVAHGGGPDGLALGASFAPQHVFVGGLVGSAGIALAFAFASFIGFEATASRRPGPGCRPRPRSPRSCPHRRGELGACRRSSITTPAGRRSSKPSGR